MKGIMLFGLISAIVILLVALYLTRCQKVEGFGRFYNEQTPFTQSQSEIYHKKLNRSLPTNTGLHNEMMIFNKALFNVDTYLATNRVPENPPFSPEEDPMPAFRERNLRECIPIKAPRYLPPHTRNPPTSCGWWYRDDDNVQSIAYLGTSNGPIEMEVLRKRHPGGEWIWDLEKAQRLEDAKRCRKIKSCETADFYPKECGFCPSLNKGIPLNTNGQPKYPTFPNLTCERSVITNPTNCPRPEPVPKVVYTKAGTILKSGDIGPNGKPIPFAPPPRLTCDPDPSTGALTRDCLIMIAKTIGFSDNGVLMKILNNDAEGYYYRAGENNDTFMLVWRIFINEAKYPLSGGMFADGAMSKAEIYSAYKRIYTISQEGSNRRAKNAARWLVYGYAFDPCEYDELVTGPFDEKCLERVALEAGCQRDGYRFPSPTTYGDYFAMRWSVVNQYFRDLYDRMQNKEIKVQRQATLDCLGIKIAVDEDLQCEDDATLLEKNVNQNPSVQAAHARIEKWRKEISEIQSPFMKQLMTEKLNEAIKGYRELVAEVQAAIARTLTPKKHKKRKLKPMAGSEVLWYGWNNDTKFPKNKYTNQPFWGREIYNSTNRYTPSFCTGGGDYNPWNRQSQMAFHLRANLTSQARVTRNLYITADDGLYVNVDGNNVIDKFFDQGPTGYTSSDFIVDSKPKPLDIYWYQNGGYACFTPKIQSNRGELGAITAKDLMLRVPVEFPLARWDFYLNADFDRNQVLYSKTNDVSLGNIAGRRALVFDGPNPWVRITNPIRGSAFKSFAMMCYCTEIPGGYNRLFAVRGGGHNDWGTSHAIEGGMTNNGVLWMGLKMANSGYENLWIQSPPGSFEMNKWTHIAFSFDNDFKGGTIFVNGIRVVRRRNEEANGDVFANAFYQGACIGHSHYPFDAASSGQPFRGGMAWVHWFDYSLSGADARADSNNDFIDESLYPEDPSLIDREVTGGGEKVIFYSQCNYKGKATELDAGTYPFQKLMSTGYQNDTLQSVYVPKGSTVILWEHDIGQGRELKLTSSNPCLEGLNYMNTVSSCRVL